ncbi:MAG: hypothetical protein ACUVQ8_06865 [Nitrososphaeria archaeon]
MNRNAKICLILATLVAVALVTTFWANMNLRPTFPGQQRLPRSIPGDIELYYTVRTVISTINATLLLILLITYIDMYLKTKSEFIVGLMIFSMVLLLNALTSNPLVHQVFGFYAFGLGPFAMLPDLFTLAALIVLLYLTFRY